MEGGDVTYQLRSTNTDMVTDTGHGYTTRRDTANFKKPEYGYDKDMA